MNRFMRAAIAAGVLLTMGAAAFAQAPEAPVARQGGGRGQGRGLTLAAIPIPVMDTFATLKDDQKTKITAIQDRYKTDMAANRPAGGQMTPEDRAKITETNRKASDDIKAVLTKEQADAVEAALPMLNLVRTSRAFPLDVIPDLKLTPDQIKKLETLATDTNEKSRAIPREERQTKMREINAEAKTQIEAMLTDTQKDIIKAHPNANPRKAAGDANAAATPKKE